MPSPWISSQLPMANSTSCCSCVIVPSALGPMLSKRFPFLLTISIRASTSSLGVLFSSPSMYPHDFLPMDESVCQGGFLVALLLHRSISNTAASFGYDSFLKLMTTPFFHSSPLL